jgi:hypothetical protein
MMRLLFAAYRAHSDDAHADPGIADDDIHKLLAASARMTRWDGAAKRVDGDIEIRPLTPELADDFLRFFDRDAFMDNPDWSGCYCLFYQFNGDNWDTATPEQNRATKEDLIRRGEAHGYLAYLDGTPVGWCHAAPARGCPASIVFRSSAATAIRLASARSPVSSLPLPTAAGACSPSAQRRL